MKYGVNTLLWTSSFNASNLDLLPDLKTHGFDGVEIARFEFNSFPAAEVRRSLETNGLECTFCSALTGEHSLISSDPEVRRKSREYLKEGIQIAAEVGSRVFAGPFCSALGYRPVAGRTDDEWKYAVMELQELGTTLASYDITLAVEPLNRFETHFLNTAEDAGRLCDEVNHPKIGVLFDTFHGNIEEKNLSEAITSLGPHLKHVHVSENDRGIPGTGHTDWRAVLAALDRVGYNQWLVIESVGANVKEIASAACIWRDLAPSAEAIAYEGLAFLKGKRGA